jgi:N-acetylmuramic acid 6-phosphate etherase
VAAVRAERAAIEQAARAMEARLRRGGRLIYAGAGTSGRLAVQDGAELIPTFNWPAEKLLLLMAGGKDALLRSAEGAEDETDQAARLIRQHRVDAADMVIAVAASGTTPFTLACLREARQRGALTIGIANNRGTPILEEADCPIRLDTGAEPIAGSTRMKAGTAQRVTLNLLSSLLMVDVQAINAKLVRRSETILRRLSGRSSEEAADALRRANGSVKLAMLLLHGCSAEEGTRLLDQAGGRLRTALTNIGGHAAAAAAAELVEDDVPTIAEELPAAVRDRQAIKPGG